MWNRAGSPAEPTMEEPMALEFSICEVRWERYRRVSENPQAREWLKFQATRGLAANTIEAYGRDLDASLGFLESENVQFNSVIRPTIGAYVRSIAELRVPSVRKKGAEVRTTTRPRNFASVSDSGSRSWPSCLCHSLARRSS